MESRQVENIRVAIRIRPFLSREQDREEIINFNDSTIRITHAKHQVESSYDKIYGPMSQQADIFSFYSEAIESATKGYNSTIFAYGQTGSGKTYTMFGADWETNNPAPQVYYGSDDQQPRRRSLRGPNGPHPLDDPRKHGIIPNTITTVFQQLRGQAVTIYCSFAQLYNEKIFDLLQDAERQKPMNIRQDAINGIFVENQAEYVVQSVADCLTLLKRGDRNRVVRQTRYNQHSSRSHTIFQLLIEYEKANSKGALMRAKINLCDLAGSEKFDNLMEGQHLREMNNINQSLSTLGKVISALGKQQTKHVPYRDSKLTRLLQDSLGVNTRTLLIAAVSPGQGSIEETVSTLKFADRAKEVMIHLKKNEIQATSNELVNRLQREVQHLKELLDIKSKGNGSMKQIQNQLWALKEENFRLKKITHNLSVEEVEAMMHENKEMRLQLQRVSTTESAATTKSFFMTEPENMNISKPSSASGSIQSPPRPSPKVDRPALPPSLPKAQYPPPPPQVAELPPALPQAQYQPPSNPQVSELPPALPKTQYQPPSQPPVAELPSSEPLSLPAIAPPKAELPKIPRNPERSELEQQLENQRLDEIKYAANELQSVMIFQGRCPICTLVPPCRHHQDSSTFPKAIEPALIKPPARLPENPRITDIVPVVSSTARSYTKSPRAPGRPNPTGKTTVRYRGRTVEHKTANVFTTEDEHAVNTSRREQNRMLQKKLRDIERIEKWREEKLRKEIEKIDAEREEEEAKAEEQRKKDERHRKYLEAQKKKLIEYDDLKRRKANIEQLEKQKAEMKQKRVQKKRAKAQELQKKKIVEYREKKRLIDGIIKDQVRELETDAVFRTSRDIASHTPSSLDIIENS